MYKILLDSLEVSNNLEKEGIIIVSLDDTKSNQKLSSLLGTLNKNRCSIADNLTSKGRRSLQF